MTLQEYLNQDKPRKNPKVELIRSDIHLITKGQSGINFMIKGISYEYFSSYGSASVYTTDSDGNKKRLSCFKLITPFTK